MGHKVSYKNIKLDPEKIVASIDVPVPFNVKCEIIPWITFYYRSFVNNVSSISSPLTALTSGYAINIKSRKCKVHWTDKCQQSFQELKDTLTLSDAHGCPHVDCPVILKTDASLKENG